MVNQTQITVALDSLGCKLNQAEIQQLAQELSRAGYRLVDSPARADIYILNTCTVTHTADHKSRHLLRMARRLNPSIRVVAIGCYAHRAPQELKKIEGVEMVIGNDRKMGLLKLLEAGSPHPLPPLIEKTGENLRRARAFLKVQDGCRNFCAYCIVPYVRTKEYSVPADKIIAQIREKTAAAFKEVVLTGTEIGVYEHEGVNLEGLLERILAETDIPRIRLSSLQPHHISTGLVKLWREPRLCPHFHPSLQSGSDATLKRMNRRYSTAGYRRAVTLLRDSVPDVAITTDVIVGFPGETDAEFRESLEFCREMRFARIHVFPFSPRPGTAAAQMPGQVSAGVKKGRSRQMLALAKETARRFQREFLGRTMEALWEQESGGIWSGLTGNYLRVYTRSEVVLAGKLTPAKLIKIYRDGVWGEV
ncbi:MAG: tRNA (N(6)-L-threonylcarbamoyladenosine(37)-C(2))-methylthiotransferase MtaB [Chloroflexi bacterium RBG_13_57_8]|nr:MAG: tRNA (N(6)-L-threonylcarbamoyladenosine(37)-C(2))-methylthiotransferase MtaB [Chloroflexi bacterium RBG_13_57_8]